jgi:hypothetical protein
VGTPIQKSGVNAMFKERRINSADRRQQNREIGVPFKDSNGVTVRGERRFIADRRASNNNEATLRADEMSGTG